MKIGAEDDVIPQRAWQAAPGGKLISPTTHMHRMVGELYWLVSQRAEVAAFSCRKRGLFATCSRVADPGSHKHNTTRGLIGVEPVSKLVRERPSMVIERSQKNLEGLGDLRK